MTPDGGAASHIASLAEALVEANDQTLALYDLATVTADSLVEAESVGEILQRAQRLLAADAMVLLGDTGDAEVVHSTGPPDIVDSLRASIDAGRSGPLSTTAVARVTNSSDMTATLAARRDAAPLGTADTKLLAAVGQLALGAIHTSRLHHAAVAQAVVARDHETASELAQRALPRWRPELPGVDLFARSEPARSAGGDLFTFVVVDDVLHFAVGDVSGKGLPAAMIMTTVISASNASFQRFGSRGPVAVVKSIDDWVYDYLSDAGLFVTLLVGSFDPATQHLRLVNAGHSPVLFVRDGTAAPVDPCLPPIGVLPVEVLEETTFEVRPGDRLAVASDGFTEQQDPHGTMFGDDRLLEQLEDRQATTAGSRGNRLFETLGAFAGSAAQSDDRTLLIIDFPGAP